jgi:long-chain acyl-CoA synthetase
VAGRDRGIGGIDRAWLQSYDADVPPDVDIPERPFGLILDDAAQRWPGSAAICHLGRETSYRELRHDVELFSTCLTRLGVCRGDRVALILPNCPQLLVGLHAVLRLGAVAVPLNAAWPQERLIAALADSGAEVVLCLDRLYEQVGAARDDPSTAVREIVVTLTTDYLPALDRLALTVPSRSVRQERARVSGTVPPGAGVRMWNEELRRARGAQVSAPGVPDGVDPGVDPAVIVYTDGAVDQKGLLSGVVLTARNLVAAGAQAAAWLAHARPGREVVLVGLPLFTAEGLSLCLGAGTLLGAALLLVPPSSGESMQTVLASARPTLLVSTPEFLADLVAEAVSAGVDLRSVRVCVTGPGPLPAEQVDRYESLTGGRVVDGLSVPGAAVVLGTPLRSGRPGHRSERPDGGQARRHGIPLPSTEVRVLDPHGEPLPVGRAGRLAVRGPQVFQGFWRRPEETSRRLRGGWLCTDVWACLHEDGWLEVLGPGVP